MLYLWLDMPNYQCLLTVGTAGLMHLDVETDHGYIIAVASREDVVSSDLDQKELIRSLMDRLSWAPTNGSWVLCDFSWRFSSMSC
jgi:hypothetical protein